MKHPALFILLQLIVLVSVGQPTAREYRLLSPNYTRWLQQTGLQQIIEYESVELQPTGKLIVKLQFVPGTPMQHAAQWRAACHYTKQVRKQQLSFLLYFSALNVFRIEPNKLEVQLCDSYTENSPNQIGITYNATSGKPEYSANLLPNQPDSATERKIQGLFISQQYLSFAGTEKAQRSQDAYSIVQGRYKLEEQRYQLHRYLTEKLRAYYKPRVQKNFATNFVARDPDKDKLEIVVQDLRQEVLKSEDNVWICKVINWFVPSADCDWRKVESVRLSIELLPGNGQSIRLKVSAEGYFGSGIFKVTDTYAGNNMEPLFDTYLRNYAEEIAIMLKNQLLSQSK